jgi:hypothetical protein
MGKSEKLYRAFDNYDTNRLSLDSKKESKGIIGLIRHIS